jgi:hypothetical protein
MTAVVVVVVVVDDVLKNFASPVETEGNNVKVIKEQQADSRR